MKCFPSLRLALRAFALCSLTGLTFCSTTLLHGQSVSYTGTSPALNFGNLNVCSGGAASPAPCSKTLTLTYNVTATGTLGTPKAVTEGASNLDYTLASGSTCTGLVTQGTSCTVKVKLAPRFAGLRKGAVEIVDASGKLLATTLIYGNGVAPQIAFDPAAQTTVTQAPDAVYSSFVVDELGYFYVPNAPGGIAKIPPDGGTPTFLNTNGLDVFAPSALDGAGNLFVNGISNIVELPASGGDPISLALGNDFDRPVNMAIDGSGNLFVLDQYYVSGNQMYAVAEIPAGGGPEINLPFAFPTDGEGDPGESLTVDSLGNVYVLYVTPPSFMGQVYELPFGGSSQVVLPPTFNSFGGYMAADAAGDLFVGNFPQVEEIPAGASSAITISAFQPPAKYSYPQNVAINPAGDVFTVLPSGDLVDLHRSQPSQLTFPETAVGATSIPLSLSIQNTGNAPLSLSSIVASGPFATVSSASSDCTTSSALAPGGRCDLRVTFTPESEAVTTGSVTLTDNELNKSGATQIVEVSGTIGDAPLAKLSATTLQYGDIAYPSSKTLPLTITNAGGGTLTLAPSINGGSYTIASSTCSAGVAAGQSCTLQLDFAPVSVGIHNDILTLVTNGSLNNGPTTVTVALRGLATGVGASESEKTIQFPSYLQGQGDPYVVMPITIYNFGVPGNVTVSTRINGPSFHIVGSTCTAGVTAGGTCTLQVQFDPASLYFHKDILTLTPSEGAAPSTIYLEGYEDLSDE
jgi:Abnormal spindle-like microcephaly-assoc'd, ASPM-SPD-2-Hydin